MSVLRYPRIYFKGYMCWDPATGNNNDFFPTYDDTRSALNWDFLATQGIDRTNFRTRFLPWAVAPQSGKGTYGFEMKDMIPAEWNFFGGNATYFVQFESDQEYLDKKSTIVGGALDYGDYVADDPLVGQPIEISGKNPLGKPNAFSPARLIDNHPVSTDTTQLYYEQMVFGSAETGISADRYVRMQSRYMNETRNFNLPAAGGASVVWQAGFPKGEGLAINNQDGSALLSALGDALGEKGVRGVSVRFCSYLNLYQQNGFFNDFEPQPTTDAEFTKYYQQALNDEIDYFSVPCYSRIVGVIGVWEDGELASVPEERLLAPTKVFLCNPRADEPCGKSEAVKPEVKKVGQRHATPAAKVQAAKAPIHVPEAFLKPAVRLGVANARLHGDCDLLSLDLSDTFPEWFWDGAKVDFGTVIVGVVDGDDFVPLAELDFGDYGQEAYEKSGGIVDLEIAAGDGLREKIRTGELAFRVSADTWTAAATKGMPPAFAPTDDKRVLAEIPLIAQTDSRGLYLDEGDEKSFQIGVRLRGRPVAARVLVAKYAPPTARFGPVEAVPAEAENQLVAFTTGEISTVATQNGKVETEVTVVATDDEGMATVGVRAAGPGFPFLVFHPFLDGEAPPVPAAVLTGSEAAFYAAIRVYPFDGPLVDRFVQLWNSTYDPDQAWQFVYDEILYLYDMLYPIMNAYVPLHDRGKVEAAIDQVLLLISEELEENSTVAMPITRDLSRGKREVLELWGSLVKRGYPPVPIARK